MAQIDLIILGSGPAAYSCAITARQKGLQVLVCGAEAEQGWLWRAEHIANYPGLPQISGKELLRLFREHAEKAGAEFRKGVVRQLQAGRRGFRVLVDNDVLSASALVLAVGAARPKLLPGEEELLGQGVSWCGTCDGMFYRGKDVAVLSWWEGGVEEADFLSGLASVCDYYTMASHDVPAQSAFKQMEGKPSSLHKEDGKIVLTIGEQTKSYDGVFLFRPAVAPDRLLPKLETDGPFIRVDRRMATSVPLVYAAGDCTGQPLQIAKAVGEGNIAAISAAEDLQKAKTES